ncbi:hypothetical protein [Cellulomonas sp. URHE0023]|uniref:hypothetical protein n=1 Tax=Cellulomonas sp. URHE0023 TaxID=1380354 RepID=UPI000481B1B4|nr:hypothetical protein [Cellulomonas sp. URHE0023]
MTAHGYDDDWYDRQWDAHRASREWDALEWEHGGPDDDLPEHPVGPVRTPDDALAVLLALVGAQRAGEPALWFVMVDAQGYTLPTVLPITDVPLHADREVVRRLLDVLGSVLAEDGPGGSVLVGLVRAAGGDRGAFEESWTRSLREGADAIGMRLWGVAAIGQSRARMLEW